MNDQVSGQLCSAWSIPPYAQGLLWIDSEVGAVRAEGEKGLFTLPDSAAVVTVRWGSADGSALARLAWQPDSLEWDGVVRVGGYIDAMHIASSGEIDGGIVQLYVGGQPLKPGVSASHTASPHVPIAPPDFYDGIDDSIAETFTTWIATDDHPALTLAQDALVSKMRVWCFGRLAAEKSRWHERFALPVWLNEMMIFT
jgi:hypothetical protein